MLLKLIALFAAACLVSCAQTEVDGAHVTGLFTSIRPDEIRAAILAANGAHPKPRGSVYEVHVVSASEMHIYRDPRTQVVSYEIVRKVGGKWQAGERAVVINE